MNIIINYNVKMWLLKKRTVFRYAVSNEVKKTLRYIYPKELIV